MRLYLLDALRLVALIQVFSIHYLTIKGSSLPSSIFFHGYFGIAIFFSISSYLQNLKLVEFFRPLPTCTVPSDFSEHITTFPTNLFLNRIRRLFPEYIFSLLIAYAFYFSTDITQNPLLVAQNLLFGVFLEQNQLINPVSWTLQYEFFYVLFTALLLTSLRFSFLRTFPPIAISKGLLIFFVFAYFSIPSLILAFLNVPFMPAGELWLTFALGPPFLHGFVNIQRLVSAICLTSWSLPLTRIFKFFTSISYSFYLLHYIILSVFINVGIQNFLILFVLTSFLSYLYLRFVNSILSFK